MTFHLLARCVLFASLLLPCFAASRDGQWQKVKTATDQRLPKSAIAALEPIITGALADRAYAEAAKAIVRKIELEGEIQGSKPEERIVRLQQEAARLPAAMQPLTEAILGHWYWQYFERNRWRFLQRTSTATSPGDDLQTWDLARILAEIDRHFTAALADPATLQHTPLRDYAPLLEPGNVPPDYRPTVFDFLAYDALAYYQSGERHATIAEDDFEVEADGPALGTTADFLAWNPTDPSGASPSLKAIQLYQALLRFHAHDSDRSAFLDADLARLDFAGNVAVGDTAPARYEQALQRFIEGAGDHPIASRALARLARHYLNAGDPAKAHALADRGYQADRRSPGSNECYNLIQEIEQRSLSIDGERIWNAPWPRLTVKYRNLKRVYFRAIAVDFERFLATTEWSVNPADPRAVEPLLDATPALAWTGDLPATTDFRERSEALPVPTTLKPGHYIVIASADPDFHERDNHVSALSVWVTDLALVLRARSDRGESTGLVVDARTGEPQPDAAVQIYTRNREGHFRAGDTLPVDADGLFSLPRQNEAFLVFARRGEQAVTMQHELYLREGHDSADDPTSKTVLFTDRAIYRPGQSIQYKGISVRAEPVDGKYNTRARHRVKVVLRDGNGQEVATTEHVTNDYGSFNGVFTAPTGRALGQLTLVAGDHEGTASIRVEEYKRPKFQVEIEAPRLAPKLGETVELTGKAAAYTGATIGAAKVRWRVERRVRLPLWCWWFPPQPAKAIAHGATTTTADGLFRLTFTAAPDRAVPEENEPVFAYVVHADVTDTTGETRSHERVLSVGYTALEATVTAEEWQTPAQPVAFTVTTKSLNGDPQPAEGEIVIHALQQPEQTQRGALAPSFPRWGRAKPEVDPTNPDSWTEGATVATQRFATPASGEQRVAVGLPAGIYRAEVVTKDRFGRKVTARETVTVVDPAAARFPIKRPHHVAAKSWTVAPGETFTALWGTGYDRGRALVEIECNGKPLQRFWTDDGRTQQQIVQKISETMRGGVTVTVTQIRENRTYFDQRVIDVPWTNKELTVKWESFRSKLTPGQAETWTAVISANDSKRVAAEMVATLYDASLDQFVAHTWPRDFGVLRTESTSVMLWSSNTPVPFGALRYWTARDARPVNWQYPRFAPDLITLNDDGDVVTLSAFSVSSGGGRSLAGSRVDTATRAASAEVLGPQGFVADAGGMEREVGYRAATGKVGGNSPVITPEQNIPPAPDLNQVAARRNLVETAFFLPSLVAARDGTVRLSFTVPEALTEWKFLGFAHDRQLRSGLLHDKVVTAKDLMVEPNAPRFVREGDTVEFTVKVTNQSDAPQSGRVRLTFAEAESQQSADAALGNAQPEQAFDVPAKESRTYSWRIAVPDGLGFLSYKAVAASATFSDGEEGALPVLSKRVLVRESLPLPIRGPATKSFAFDKLLASGSSPTLRQQSLTVQMVSQPAWYAVMALPYLIEYPYECSEQVFNRYYANALAQHIATSNPKIRRVFDQWKATPALDSPLEKNPELKSIALEETPWVRQARQESEARRNVGLLFDQNRLADGSARALATLADRQGSDGMWSWFPGGRPSEYITLYITTGFGRLRHLGVGSDVAPAVKSLAALDDWMTDRYAKIRERPRPDDYVPSSIDALYLYGRSFFLEDQAISAAHRPAIDFYLGQAKKHWGKVGSRQSEAHLALALARFGDKATAAAILRSLKERAVMSEELGMFWRDTELSWWWYHAPIESQATMIEAFSEVAEDGPAVEALKVWLLKQKQTQDWRTTKATADAIYALLLRGENLLASDARVEVSLGGKTIEPEHVEAGTGFYEQTFVRDEIKPAMGQVTVKKTDAGVSWGSVHWQYLEDMAKVTPHTATPLQLKKSLWIKQTTAKGQTLQPVKGPVAVGDELVVRLELRTDRDLEFVHLKDQRASGTEPVNVLSRYRFQDGLAYYESTRDTASHFFIDYLPKGTYVFEYSTRVQLRGRYQTGFAEIQCMYAPEFSSNSESLGVEVK